MMMVKHQRMIHFLISSVWSERTLNTLKATHMGGATMIEIYYDLLITRKNNVSHSFGLKRSIGAFDTI